jgi:hypothetical protein
MGSIVKTGKFDWFFGQKAICYQSRDEIDRTTMVYYAKMQPFLIAFSS